MASDEGAANEKKKGHLCIFLRLPFTPKQKAPSAAPLFCTPYVALQKDVFAMSETLGNALEYIEKDLETSAAQSAQISSVRSWGLDRIDQLCGCVCFAPEVMFTH